MKDKQISVAALRAVLRLGYRHYLARTSPKCPVGVVIHKPTH